MLSITSLKDDAEAISAVVGAVLAAGGIARWFVRNKLPKVQEKRAIQKATDEVIRGRAAIEPNRITGEEGRDAIPPLGERLAGMAQLIQEIHHELHPNGGSSMKDSLTRVEARVETIDARVETVDRRLENGDRRFDRIEHVLQDELHVAHDTVANAAEAAANLLPAIHDAIKAQPPD